ncbi:restriction endonuclease subunit S [Streptomyces sp. NPDC014685]|uniref:restriction endonuclease subunit S n=1 Tax=Streptomyces sp. NPDC014685 TaxID=3364881 RepID=UPI0036FCE840
MSEKELPAGWAKARLDEIAEVRLGRQRSPKNHSGNQMRPYLRAANVGWSGLKLDDVKEMNFTDDEVAVYRLVKGDIVLGEASGSAGEVGKPAIWNAEIEDCCFQNTLIRVRSILVDPRYLLHYLRYEALRGAFVEGSRGVGIHHLGAAKLSSWPVQVPPLAEQHRIVEALEGHLSRLDAAVRLLKGSTRRLSLLADSVVSAMLSDGSGSPVEPLEGLLREPLRNGHSARVTADADGVRTLNLTAVTLNDFRDENTKITSADPSRVKGLWLEPGDILIQRSNTPELVGTAAIFNGSKNWAIYPDLLIRVRTDSRLDPEFATMVLRSKVARNYFKSKAKGLAGSMPKIDQAVIANFQMPVPPIEEQKRLVAEVAAKIDVTARVGSQLNRQELRAASLRSALLRHAFNGALVPQDPADESATALLARIQAERAAQPKVKRARRAPAPRRAKAPATAAPAPSPTPAPTHAVQQEFDL